MFTQDPLDDRIVADPLSICARFSPPVIGSKRTTSPLSAVASQAAIAGPKLTIPGRNTSAFAKMASAKLISSGGRAAEPN
jgi:hypothetical protein